MTALEKIAYFRKRRDEVPNQELARELAQTKDHKGIREIADNLWHKNKSVRSDCLKVLYEIGYTNPELIEGYVDDFLKLLTDKENRMIWGAMIGLANIAELRPKEIGKQIDAVTTAIEKGTLITFVWGIKTVARISAADKSLKKKLFPFLMDQLNQCMARDLPLHAESILCAVDKNNKKEFIAVLESRQNKLTPPQLKRLKKAIKAAEAK